jgi:prophage antirepressor-like protein
MDIVKAFSSNNFHTEITIRGTHDKPLFRASDIGEVLEMGNIRTSIVDFDSSEKVVQVMDSLGGAQQVTFLTAKGLYKVLFRSRKPIAEQFQNWVCDVVEELRLNGQYSLQSKVNELENKLQEAEQSIEELEKQNISLSDEKIPSIYIYNIDTRATCPELKIGYTINVQTRIRPYKQVCKHGRLEFSHQIYNKNIKVFENFIHNMLSDFLVKDEVFRIDVEEAKIILLKLVNDVTLLKNPNSSERQLKLKKLLEYENIIVNNHDVKISTREMSTQTDFYENTIEPTLLDNDEQKVKFNKFIEEHCILHNDAEVSGDDIIGQYRILQKSASNEQNSALKLYLDIRFRQTRLKCQEKDQIIHGYSGVKLKEIEYKKSLIVSDEQDFTFHSCLFHPNGKVLFAVLIEEYKKWKISLNKEVSDDDNEKLKKYLKSTNYVHYATIWANNTNGQGYYGIMLKKDVYINKSESSTGKRVEKRDVKSNHLIAQWKTIAKAAESEKMCSAKMSRSIKNKTVFNNDYYYCCVK